MSLFQTHAPKASMDPHLGSCIIVPGVASAAGIPTTYLFLILSHGPSLIVFNTVSSKCDSHLGSCVVGCQVGSETTLFLCSCPFPNLARHFFLSVRGFLSS